MAGYEDTPAELNGFELGFLEKAKPWHLMSHLFPNKVGGKPAWLALSNLPTQEELLCSSCQEPLIFLMQVYCPVDENDACFHRTIFLFMCLNGKCFLTKNSAKPFAVFRCQLPRNNNYYTFEPPPESSYSCSLSEYEAAVGNNNIPHASKLTSLCRICGCPGSKSCAKCKSVFYCSKEHQLIDWKSGNHKSLCPDIASGAGAVPSPLLDFQQNSAVLPEFEIIMGPDPHGSRPVSPFDEDNQNASGNLPRSSSPVCPTEEEKHSLEEIMKKYSGGDAIPDSDSTEINGLEEVAKKETPQDKVFLKFKEIISPEPDQVLRYHRNGSPLWIAPVDGLGTPGAVPACENCGASRMFEFQVTPQLLHYLKLDNRSPGCNPADPVPDWGCLYVFTCSRHCTTDNNSADKKREYFPEYLIRQDIS